MLKPAARAQHGRRGDHRCRRRGRSASPVRPLVAEAFLLGAIIGVDGRRRGLRDAPLHAAATTSRPRSRPSRSERPDGGRAHARPDRLGRAAAPTGSATWLAPHQAARDRPRGRRRARLCRVRLLRRLPPTIAPFAPVASIGTAAFSYGVAASRHGSGFLAVYIVALWVGNTLPFREQRRRLPRRARLPRPGRSLRRARPARLPEPARPRRVVRARADRRARLRCPARRGRRSRCASLPAPASRSSLLGGPARAVPIVLATFALSAGIAATTRSSTPCSSSSSSRRSRRA